MINNDNSEKKDEEQTIGNNSESLKETWSGGLTVFDRRPYEAGPVKSSQGKERIYLGSQNGDAGLVIRDAQERERIRIGVGRDGVAVIEILGDDGKAVHRFAER